MDYIKRFDNGLRLVVKYLPGMLSVTTGVYAGVGSSDEELALNGISHFIEHMMFKGTKTRTAFEIADSVDSVGAQINAFTTKECTCYYTKSTADHFDFSMEILSDLLFESLFDPKEMEREKGVVLEEISMEEDTPDDLASDLLAAAYYGEHPLGRTILGSAVNVKSFTRDNILDYLGRWYNPANMVISVAGCIEYEQACDATEKWFASRYRNQALRRKKAPAHRGAPAFKAKVKEIEQANICIGFPGICFDDENNNEFSLLNSIFGGGMSSRLFQRVREEKGLAYSVYSYNTAYQNNGVLSIYAGINPKNTKLCVRTIKEEIERFAREGITQKEFERGREQLKSAFVFGQENTATIMNALGKYLLMTDKLMSFEEKIQKINALSLDKINGMAKDMFDFSRVCASYVGPNGAQDQILELLKN